MSSQPPEIVYKLFAHRSHTDRRSWYLTSAVTHRAAALVSYAPQEWSAAPEWLASLGYHLTAFEELKLAQNFRWALWGWLGPGASQGSVWKCHATGIIREDLPPIRGIAQYEPEFLPVNFESHWPYGTIMCKSLLPLERMA